MSGSPILARLAATSVYGTVDYDLPLVNGVVATVPTIQLNLLGLLPGVIVAPDLPVSVADAATQTTARAPSAVFPQATEADKLVAQGTTGRGVNVAVLDTGIDRLQDFARRLVDGTDLSGENDPFLDSYGHGTFVAGVIAGDGASSGGRYAGEAPGAGLVSVKVAGSSGRTDMATVIAGISWVVANRAQDHIGVLNISLGVIPVASTVVNPLDRAVEAAWRSGVTVVTSAGNSGPTGGTVLSPGDDPLVITAGASDDKGTSTTSDDSVADFSSVGPTSADGWSKPDLVAPGRSLVSLRAPGSTIDTTFASARIGSSNFVGSGTSFSAGVTSGAAALVLQAGGTTWLPDAVKAKLLGAAAAGPVGNPFIDGHGALNAYQAATSGAVSITQPTPVIPGVLGGALSILGSGPTSSWNSGAWNSGAWNSGAWNSGAWNSEMWN